MSVKFVSAILGLEMAAPILWAPRISAFFLQENFHVHKIPRFGGGGGGILGLGGGGSADYIFMGAGIFLNFCFCSEPIFGKGMSTATFQFSESGGSLNGPDLFTKLPFL